MMMTKTEVLTRIERLSADRLEVCVRQAWVRPYRGEAGPVFDETDVARLNLIVELTEDMAVNEEAVPVILGLLDEVGSLRKRARAIDAALNAEGEAVCDAVLARLQQFEQTGR
ncbi:chaperone modulator CbpM [Martelella mediterranea]|uniref:Chaperone modulatory protein CbpM n=1 Tax=Martelella mediterranea TaxID=293089 RepID=A0A4R3P5B4_9HYPH|nr:chaperone modulator CbpM [Martelella mediterranea]TCT44712.1 chaperone modulatory protein CbpM [Martelella mediterranea]